MRQAMSASRGSSGVHRPRPKLPRSHSGASASTTSRLIERAGAKERGGVTNSSPRGPDVPGSEIMRRSGRQRVAHYHAHDADVIGRPVREPLTDLPYAPLATSFRL